MVVKKMWSLELSNQLITIYFDLQVIPLRSSWVMSVAFAPSGNYVGNFYADIFLVPALNLV